MCAAYELPVQMTRERAWFGEEVETCMVQLINTRKLRPLYVTPPERYTRCDADIRIPTPTRTSASDPLAMQSLHPLMNYALIPSSWKHTSSRHHHTSHHAITTYHAELDSSSDPSPAHDISIRSVQLSSDVDATEFSVWDQDGTLLESIGDEFHAFYEM